MNETSRNIASGFPNRPFSTALIAGCGYVGHRVARLWQANGSQTSAITRSAAKAASLQAEQIQPLILDLASPDVWPTIPNVDVVLWSVGFDRSSGSNRQAIWLDGLSRLLAALPVRSGSRTILYTSSTGVYGDGVGQEVDEQTLPNPTTEGGVACVAAEKFLQEYARTSNAVVRILRLAGIYGPNRLLRRVSELRQGTPLTSAPDEWLNLIHVDDAVRVIDCIANSKMANPCGKLNEVDCQVLNVVSANSVTRRTYYSTLARIVAAPEPVFQTATVNNDAVGSQRHRGGNRRVVSRYRSSLPVEFLFDDCEAGLTHAVRESLETPA